MGKSAEFDATRIIAEHNRRKWASNGSRNVRRRGLGGLLFLMLLRDGQKRAVDCIPIRRRECLAMTIGTERNAVVHAVARACAQDVMHVEKGRVIAMISTSLALSAAQLQNDFADFRVALHTGHNPLHWRFAIAAKL